MPSCPSVFLLRLLLLLLSLWFWISSLTEAQFWIYGSAFAVLVGVVGETITDFTPWVKLDSLNNKIQKLSAIMLILGLTGDIIGIRKTEEEMALLRAKAGDAAISAETAREEATKATGEADAASKSAGEAQQKVGMAMVSAKTARDDADAAGEKAREVDQKAADLMQKYRDTENELDNERATRQDLEKSIQPRELFIITYADGTSNLDDLRKFSGTSVALRYVPDFESERAARFIASVLDKSGWKILGVEKSEEYMFDGVQVERYQPPEMQGPVEHPEYVPLARASAMSQNACDAVVDFLIDGNWNSMPGVALGIPVGSVRISVGFKPNPYFLPEPFKDAQKQFESIRKRERPRRNTTGLKGTIEGVMPWFPPPQKP